MRASLLVRKDSTDHPSRAFPVDAIEEEWLLYRDILDRVFHIFRALGRPENPGDPSGRSDKSGLLVDITSTVYHLSQIFRARKSLQLVQRITTTYREFPPSPRCIHREFLRREKHPADPRRSAWRIANIPSYSRRKVIIPILFKARVPYRAKPGNYLSMMRTSSG